MCVSLLHDAHLLLTTTIKVSNKQTQLTLRSQKTLNMLISIPYTINYYAMLYIDNIYAPRQLTILFVIIFEYISIHMHCLTPLPAAFQGYFLFQRYYNNQHYIHAHCICL